MTFFIVKGPLLTPNYETLSSPLSLGDTRNSTFPNALASIRFTAFNHSSLTLMNYIPGFPCLLLQLILANRKFQWKTRWQGTGLLRHLIPQLLLSACHVCPDAQAIVLFLGPSQSTGWWQLPSATGPRVCIVSQWFPWMLTEENPCVKLPFDHAACFH